MTATRKKGRQLAYGLVLGLAGFALTIAVLTALPSSPSGSAVAKPNPAPQGNKLTVPSFTYSGQPVVRPAAPQQLVLSKQAIAAIAKAAADEVEARLLKRWPVGPPLPPDPRPPDPRPPDPKPPIKKKTEFDPPQGDTFQLEKAAAEGEKVLRDNCMSCHGGPKPKGGFSMFSDEDLVYRLGAAQWQSVLDRIKLKGGKEAMPPEPRPRLTPAQVASVAALKDLALRPEPKD